METDKVISIDSRRNPAEFNRLAIGFIEQNGWY